MATINFVPDDYIEQRQSSRANLLYLMLLTAMLGAIGVTFGFIKMRQRDVHAELAALESRMVKANEQIAQLEELKVKSKTMMKTMVVTAELLESIPRSIVLASITNDLPSGVSLAELDLSTKETKIVKPTAKTAAAAAAQAEETQVIVNTTLNLKGIAPSDIQVASYIANLSRSILLDNVELVESKELEVEGVVFREFKLKAALKPGLMLSKEDINDIRNKAKQMS
jgi:Tfp pilus assembly protein PilN